MRILTALLAVVAILVAPAGSPSGRYLIGVVALLAVLCAGLPLRHAAGVAGMALIFYLPLAALLVAPSLGPLLLAGLRTAAAGGDVHGWATAALQDSSLELLATIVLRGGCALLVAVAAISTLSPREARPALGALPLPVTVRLILLQIVQQTGMLRAETSRVRDAIRVRSGPGGNARLIGTMPVAWLARVGARAERVAKAMDARGYVEAPLPPVTSPARWTPADRVALGAGVALLGVAFALRVTG